MGDCIGIDISAGACHKVFITYSGGDKCENKLEITKLMNEEIKKDNKYNLSLTALLPSKFVFNQIKACINPAIYDMAFNDVPNETHDEDNNYPVKFNYEYPLSFSDNKKELTVSLVLLDDIPKDNILAKYFFQVCGLGKAVSLADKALAKIKFFTGSKGLDQKSINSEEEQGDAGTSAIYTEYLNEDENITYNEKLGKKIFDHDGETEGVELDISNTRMAFICFANTIRGEIVLNKLVAESGEAICQTTACESRIYHMEYNMLTDGTSHNLKWIGRGRFNPRQGYMPGGVILAHEIGHSIYGGRYGDYVDGPVNSKKNNNLEINENPMRVAYGMFEREYYFVFNHFKKDLHGCYNTVGVKLDDCPPLYQHLVNNKNKLKEYASQITQTPMDWNK